MALNPSYSTTGAIYEVGGVKAQAVVQVDGSGTEVVPGGSVTATVVAGSGAAAQVIKASAGRLCRVVVTTAGAEGDDLKFYDNKTAASGTVIGVVPGAATLGQSFDFQMPAANGITAGRVNGSPAVTVSYY